MSESFSNSARFLTAAFAAAAPGAVLQGQLFPLVGEGQLRVTYNWLYSALNSDPNDNSLFNWVINKMPNGQVSLSPAAGFNGMTLFASVRPDWNYFVQVQAPNSADWITQAAGDEALTMTELGLLTINLRGLNNQYLAVNVSPTSHDWHAGYKLQSNAGQSTNIFVAVSRQFQAVARVPSTSEIGAAALATALQEQGVAQSGELSEKILKITG
jgi:hypothetical protein